MKIEFFLRFFYFFIGGFHYFLALFFLSTNMGVLRDFQKISKEINDSKKEIIDFKLINALIMAEDHRYKFHRGVDYISVVRAIISTVFYKKFQGASTIEQQLSRVISFRYERTWRRKIREQLLAILVSSCFEKEEIAKCYLINCYLGYRYKGLFSIIKSQDFEFKNDFHHFIASLPKYPVPRGRGERWEEKIKFRMIYIKNRELKYQRYKLLK